MRPFHVAETYDPLALRIMPYQETAAFMAGRLQASAPHTRAILDLACGTGNLTFPLAELGYQVVGLDVCPEMLAVAEAKAATNGRSVTFVCQDMRQPYQGGSVDAVTCFFGGLNYADSPAALRQTFTAVHKALKPGGLLVFELFSPEKLRAMHNGLRAADYGDFYVVSQSQIDEASHVVQRVTYFLRQADGSYRREEEEHHLQIHTQADLEQALAETGFTLLSVEPVYPAVPSAVMKDVTLFVAQS
ncbi:MAG: methyltransferase domain-containing protein [Chloroflexota bacterium]